jgi:hypothetical protein
MRFAALASSVLVVSAASVQTSFEDLGLTITPPPLERSDEHLRPKENVERALWEGQIGATTIEITLRAFPLERWGFDEPGGVTVVMVDWRRQTGDFDVDEAFERAGKFGYAPLLSVVGGPVREGRKTIGREYAGSGLLKDFGYSLHVVAKPEPSAEVKQVLLDFFEKGIAYAGPERDPLWTMDEVRARWAKDAPNELMADFERKLSKPAWVKDAVLRTEHYLVLTNASGGKKFAEQMETNYAAIGKIFPLPAAKGARLLPVFLFRTAEDYYAFSVKRGMTMEAAKKSKGHAAGDYYATWYESPTDSTHIHEQTHQLFQNRLFLSGGGSWFQEGVAEYVESSKNARNVVANQVAKGRHLPLSEFFERKSLLWSSDTERKSGGSEASDLYNQAGLFIEFLRESPFGKARFPRFLETVGRVRRNDLPKIEAALREIYDVDLVALDQAFQKYCKDR